MKLTKVYREYLQRFKGKTLFMQGDIACAYGALYGGCNFLAGYPITPASEIAEQIALEFPKVGGYAIQMEDEIASIAAVIGAVWAGARAMTVTSGPGFSLMQENIGYAIMTETPCVIVDVQRSGPSTGQATKPAQGDVLQARWGTHGDHEIIALSPSSVQECLNLTIECFNLSEEYRTPVILLMDGEVGHMREKIVMPDPDKIKLTPRRFAKTGELMFGGELIPPMTEFGAGLFAHVTGSTHKENGMRDVESQRVHDKLIKRLYDKIDKNRDKLVRVEKDYVGAGLVGAKRKSRSSGAPALAETYVGAGLAPAIAETAVVCYGVTARPTRGAVIRARKEGKQVDFLRLIGIWPFPREVIRELGKRVKKIYVPEMNLGQLSREIERFVSCEVISIPKIGGIPHTVSEIYSKIV